MPITGWIAILVLIVMCYMLIKQYETRMVLFGGGFILCCISLTPMAGLNAFASSRGTGFPAPLSQHPSCGTAMGASLTNLHKAERVQA